MSATDGKDSNVGILYLKHVPQMQLLNLNQISEVLGAKLLLVKYPHLDYGNITFIAPLLNFD